MEAYAATTLLEAAFARGCGRFERNSFEACRATRGDLAREQLLITTKRRGDTERVVNFDARLDLEPLCRRREIEHGAP
jgi:hypothetical protein